MIRDTTALSAESFDVLIIGGGITGSCMALSLRLRRHRRVVSRRFQDRITIATVHVDPLLSIVSIGDAIDIIVPPSEEFTQYQHGYLTIIDNPPPDYYLDYRADFAMQHATLCELRLRH